MGLLWGVGAGFLGLGVGVGKWQKEKVNNSRKPSFPMFTLGVNRFWITQPNSDMPTHERRRKGNEGKQIVSCRHAFIQSSKKRGQ